MRGGYREIGHWRLHKWFLWRFDRPGPRTIVGQWPRQDKESGAIEKKNSLVTHKGSEHGLEVEIRMEDRCVVFFHSMSELIPSICISSFQGLGFYVLNR